MDKATPTPSPATVDSVMALAMKFGRSCHADGESKEMMRGDENRDDLAALRAEVERLAAQAAPTAPGGDVLDERLEHWLKKNEKTLFNEWLSRLDIARLAWKAALQSTQAPAAAQRAPVVQSGGYPPLPKPEWWIDHATDKVIFFGAKLHLEDKAAFTIKQMHAYVDADRASSGAAQAVRMLTDAEQTAIIDMHSTGRAQGDHECAEDIQRKFAKVNGLRIPADGKIGSAA